MLVLLLTLLLAMASTADDDLWQENSIADTQPSQLQPDLGEEASLDGNTATVRRSSQLASKTPNAPCLSGWPMSKILEMLFKNNIQPPIGASHEDLFAFLCDNLDIPQTDATPVPPAQPAGKKHNQKRKHTEPGFAGQKRSGGQTPSGGVSAPPSSDPLLEALFSIQSSLGDMNCRISTLENSRSAPFSSADVSAARKQDQHFHQAPCDDVIPQVTPRRTLATAVPVSTGAPFFPLSAALSHHLRSRIIAGNDINLVKILLGAELCDRRVVGLWRHICSVKRCRP